MADREILDAEVTMIAHTAAGERTLPLSHARCCQPRRAVCQRRLLTSIIADISAYLPLLCLAGGLPRFDRAAPRAFGRGGPSVSEYRRLAHRLMLRLAWLSASAGLQLCRSPSGPTGEISCAMISDDAFMTGEISRFRY